MPHPERFCILPADDCDYKFDPIFIEPPYNEATKGYDPHHIGLKFNPLFEKIAIQALPPVGVERSKKLREKRVSFMIHFSYFGNDGENQPGQPPPFPGNEHKPEKILADKTKIRELSF
jgi:hypothetical protein